LNFTTNCYKKNTVIFQITLSKSFKLKYRSVFGALLLNTFNSLDKHWE